MTGLDYDLLEQEQTFSFSDTVQAIVLLYDRIFKMR